jgi:predicted nucleic acid-binding protein
VNLNRAAFDLATLLCAENNPKTPDALYLAAAIQAGCDEFCINDKQRVKGAT